MTRNTWGVILSDLIALLAIESLSLTDWEILSKIIVQIAVGTITVIYIIYKIKHLNKNN